MFSVKGKLDLLKSGRGVADLSLILKKNDVKFRGKNGKKIIGFSISLDFKGAKCYIVEFKYLRQGYYTRGSFRILMVELLVRGQQF